MATDMDIDIDLDLDMPVESMEAEHADIPLYLNANNSTTQQLEADPDATKPTLHKIHVRGLDELTSDDIKAYAAEYYSADPLDRIEWIDDTSANLVYSTPAIALKALTAFAANESDVALLSGLQTVPAKPFPKNPNAALQLRFAVVRDRKQAGARDRSRFYLLNPRYDPAERRQRENSTRGLRRYRDRDDEGYQSRYYDRKEQQRVEETNDFDVNLYDDDEAILASRAARRRQSSVSSGEYRSCRSRRDRRDGGSKELFPDKVAKQSYGRLRDRSASPMRVRDGDVIAGGSSTDNSNDRLARDNGISENRVKAQLLKKTLKEAASKPVELFPNKASSHRITAEDGTLDAAADLFASRIVPFIDETGGVSQSKGDLASRIRRAGEISTGNASDVGFSIRGASKQRTFSIKGLADGGSSVKELFPNRLNAGKELVSDRLENRIRKARQKAEDMFS